MATTKFYTQRAVKPTRAIVLATKNQGKVREMRDLFGDLPVRILSLAEFPDVEDVEETGSTFRENAELKAREFSRQTGELCLADDSGLEIEALGGEPGIRSARFGGSKTGYDIKNAMLLRMIAETGSEMRSARFVCAMALAGPNAEVIQTVEGVCNGKIAHAARGSNGFGYDPIFIPDGYDETFGELSDDVKRRISHRARAADEIVRYLLDFIAN